MTFRNPECTGPFRIIDIDKLYQEDYQSWYMERVDIDKWELVRIPNHWER